MAIAILTLLTTTAFAADDLKRTPIFNGKDLSGWKAIGSAEWKVEDGVISGGQFGNPKKSGLLATETAYANFDLELEFMIDEHGKYNSGVYIRKDLTKKPSPAYQVNIGRGAGGEYIGLHYKDWLSKGDEKDEIRKKLVWNQMRIRAEGNRIQVWLNGRQIVDHTDAMARPELSKSGAIAFQTYGAEGHAGWVKFRNIRIAELK
jgi:hypothetical protein